MCVSETTGGSSRETSLSLSHFMVRETGRVRLRDVFNLSLLVSGDGSRFKTRPEDSGFVPRFRNGLHRAVLDTMSHK